MPTVLKPKEDEGPTVTTSFRAPTRLIEDLDAAAKESGLSRNEALNQLLRFALDENKKGQRK